MRKEFPKPFHGNLPEVIADDICEEHFEEKKNSEEISKETVAAIPKTISDEFTRKLSKEIVEELCEFLL